MNIKRSLSFGIIISYIGRFTQIASNIIFLPLLFRKLGSNEVGFWLLIGQAGIFVGLMDFGFTNTLTRRVAFASQNSNAGSDESEDSTFDLPISTVIFTGRKLYSYLAILVFIVSMGSGLWFLSSVPDTQSLKLDVYLAWILLCVGYATNTWAGAWSCILSGMGKVSQQGIITTSFQLVGWILKIAVVVLGGGIVGLAATEVFVGLISRLVFVLYVKKSNPDLLVKDEFSRALVISMAKPALIAWVTSLAAYAIYRTDQYFILLRLGIKAIPNYQAAATVIDNLLNVAMIVGLTSAPFYSIFWRQKDYSKFNILVYSNAKSSLAVTLTGGICILTLSPHLFDLWLGKGHFIGFAILTVFVVRTCIQAIHWNLSQAIRATEHEKFMWPAIATALINLLLSYYLSIYFGLLGIAIATAVAEISTVLISTFYYAHHRIGIKLIDYWNNVGLSISGLLLALGFIFLLTLMPNYPVYLLLYIKIFAVFMMGCLLLYYLLNYSLPENMREQLKAGKLKFFLKNK